MHGEAQSGKGSYTFHDGSLYEGKVNPQGVPEGNGVKHFANGSRLAAFWEKGVAKKRAFTFSDGSRYDGELNSDGKPHGEGTKKMGIERIQAIWSNGEPTQLIHTLFNDEGSKYTGEINSDGKPHGNGAKTFDNGIIFEATWMDGLLQDVGQVYKCADGTPYEGTFDAEGRPEGFKRFDDGSRVTVQRVNGKVNRVYTFADGSSYEGALNSEGKPDLEGTRTFPNGDTLKDQWVNGVPQNKGRVYTFDGGSTYIGSFNEQGQPHEWGLRRTGPEQTSVLEAFYSGRFANGKFEGNPGRLQYKDRSFLIGTWSGDVFVKGYHVRQGLSGAEELEYQDGKPVGEWRPSSKR